MRLIGVGMLIVQGLCIFGLMWHLYKRVKWYGEEGPNDDEGKELYEEALQELDKEFPGIDAKEDTPAAGLIFLKKLEEWHAPQLFVRRCRVCGCTDDDCRQCIEKTGAPCYWVEKDLCSACAGEVK
jgi:hypothetical protein